MKYVKKVIGKLFDIAAVATFCLSLPFLFIVYKLKKFKIGHLQSERIGGLVGISESLLRNKDFGKIEEKTHIILVGVASSNNQLVKMYRQHFTIFINKWVHRAFVAILPLLKKTPFYINTREYFSAGKYYTFSHSQTRLRFDPEDERKGREFLKTLGLKEQDWYVCIHARTPVYLETYENNAYDSSMDHSYHDYRDCDIKHYLMAAEFITSKGGYVIRMGCRGEPPLETNNKMIIDYANKYSNDFLDVFVSANCRFFLGNTSGLYLIPTVFGRPIANANYIPLPHSPLAFHDLYIPKLYLSKNKKRYESFDELYKSSAMNIFDSNSFKEFDWTIVENTEEDILMLCQEMWEQIEAQRVKETQEQKKFKNNYLVKFDAYKDEAAWAGRISQRFLEKYPYLL